MCSHNNLVLDTIWSLTHTASDLIGDKKYTKIKEKKEKKHTTH